MTIYGSNIWSWCNWTKNDRHAECRGIRLPKFPESIVGLYPTMHALYSMSFTKNNPRNAHLDLFKTQAVQAQKIDILWHPTSPSHGIAIGSVDPGDLWWPIGSKSGCPQVDSGCSWKMLENVVCQLHVLDGTVFWQARHFHAKVLAISSVDYSLMHPATARRCVLTCTLSCQAVE